MIELKDAEIPDLKKLKELTEQPNNGVEAKYSSSAGKIAVWQDGRIIGYIQYKPILFIEGVYLDQNIPIIHRAYIFKQTVEALNKLLIIPCIWVSKRYRHNKKGKMKENTFVNWVYSRIGKSFNHRKRIVWRTID